jgi:hypothetical protein
MMAALTILGITVTVIFVLFLGLLIYAYVTWPDETELERRRKNERDRWVKDVLWMTQKLDISEEEKDERNID